MTRIKLLFIAVVFVSFTQADVTRAGQSIDKQAQGPYFIQGAVNKPGVYQIEGSASVSKLIALAGGLSETHAASAFIIRRATPKTEPTASDDGLGREYSVIRIDLRGLLKGEFHKDAVLSAGDILNIPVGEMFFVTGEVNRVRTYPLSEGLTVSQAISLAGGVNSKARIDAVAIFRGNPATGKREEIKVDLREVMRGKAIDVPIEPNDIIVVPGSQSGITPSRFLDAPPIRVTPCRGARPCMARSGKY